MFKQRWGRTALIIVMLLVLNAPVFAMAAGLPDKIVTCDGVNCTVCDLAKTSQNILNAAIYILVFLSAVLFAWAGWKMLTAGGDSEGYAQGKSILTNVVIGLVIVLAGWIVVDTVMKTLVPQSGPLGPWNKIC